MCKYEIKEIKNYQTTNILYGYNITNGGDGCNGLKHTKEWKQAMSKRMSGKNNPFYGKKLTKSQKDHLSKINSKKNHPQFGKNRSNDTKNKIRKKGNASENRYNSKLTWGNIREIRAKYNNGCKINILSKEYNVAWSTISDVVKNRTWKEKNEK